MQWRRRLVVIGVGLVGVMAACGGDNGQPGNPARDAGEDRGNAQQDSSVPTDATTGTGTDASAMVSPSVDEASADGSLDAASDDATDALESDAGLDAASDGAADTLEDVVDGAAASADAADTGDAAPLCGNGTLDPGEQCDDGNRLDLDGCDSSCHYELVVRMTSLAISGTAAPAALRCTPATNALGTKVFNGTIGLDMVNTSETDSLNTGTSNSLLQFLGLSDLTGTNASGFDIGAISASPDPNKGTWPTGSAPIDWWFLADPNTVSAGVPTGLFLSGNLVNHALSAGPADVAMPFWFGDVAVRSARLSGTIGAPTDTPAPPPSALEAGIAVLETITAGLGQGLCGNLTVESLAQIPVPSIFAGTSACTVGYTACVPGQTPASSSCNSLLDVFVGGCVGSAITVINPTQPDVAAGATVTPLTLVANHKVAQATAGDFDAYSAFFTWSANRVHLTGETCTTAGQCQSGQTCTTGRCN
jgi:cysteine-rich repeat protein